MVFFINSVFTLPAPTGGMFAYMLPRSAPRSVAESNGVFSISTVGLAAGVYYFQVSDSTGAITDSGTFELRVNIANATASDDPRTSAEITLEAIDAALANRASVQQRAITVGDKSIQYSTFSELLEWREHFAKIVAKERGHSTPEIELVTLKGAR